jgi:hypothetical protein
MIISLSENLKKEMDLKFLFIICFIKSTINSFDYRDDYTENEEYETHLYEPDRRYRYVTHFYKECKKRRYFQMNQ